MPVLSTSLILGVIGAYFLALVGISWWRSRGASADAYFLGNKSSPWYLVAFGMIGDSLSGVTFVSVPGKVGADHFQYLQIVLGYLLGYLVIAKVLLPLYYRLNLTSIYTYLEHRFGQTAQKTGSAYFLLSRSIGAAFRLYVSAEVLQIFLFDRLGVPFAVSVTVIIVLMLLYTLKGGIRSLIWTDTFQSLFLLLGVVLTAWSIMYQMDWSLSQAVSNIAQSEYAQVFNWDYRSPLYFWKQFISGAFIAIVMTGLDQNMMQKNLSCRTLPEAQKNVIWFSVIVVVVNVIFVSLGALMYMYASSHGVEIPKRSDHLLPMLTLNHLGSFAAIFFLLGITAATFSSADSVLTTLTTSCYIDILRLDRRSDLSERTTTKYRAWIHAGFSVLLLLIILIFRAIHDSAVIDGIFKAAGYTYGPLLGLFAFGILSKWQVKPLAIVPICLIAPVLSYLISLYSPLLFGGYQVGFELLLINGFLTFLGLFLLRKNPDVAAV